MSEQEPSGFKPPLPLRATTPESWADAAWADPEGLLSDHAHNEKKAALTALSLVHAFAGHPRIPLLLARLAEEELNHFRRVLEALAAFGWTLRRDGGSAYAKGLLAHVAKGSRLREPIDEREHARRASGEGSRLREPVGEREHARRASGGRGADPLLDRLLVSALIEARSCERLHLLEKAARGHGHLATPEWLSFLFELERCEAGHALTYLRIAEDRFGDSVPARLDAWLDWEAEVIRGLPFRSVVH